MTDPIRTSVRPNPANTEALHGGDTLDAGGVTLTAPRRHGGAQGSRATDHFTSSTPNGANDTIRRATHMNGSAMLAAQNRERAVRVLAQLQSIPMPQDPRTNMPPRPAQTLQQLIHSQHEASSETIRNSAIATGFSAGVGVVTQIRAEHAAERAAEHLTGHLAREAAEHARLPIEIQGANLQAATNVAGMTYGVGSATREEVWTAFGEGAADTIADVAGEAFLPGGPGLLQGATAQLLAVAHTLHDHDARNRLAGQWSEYDRARNEINENERMGRMTAESQVSLMKRGEITGLTEADLHRAATDFGYRSRLQSMLTQWANGG